MSVEGTEIQGTRRRSRLWVWVPPVVRREFRTRGSDARFLMWISFLAGFLYVHLVSLSLSETGDKNVDVGGGTKVGAPFILGDYHPHHIAAGVFMLAVAGWLGIHYGGAIITRVMAVLYGVGLGFIVDEIGFIVDGIGSSYGRNLEIYTVVVIVSAVMMSSIYFPSFWEGVEKKVSRLYARILTRRRLRGGRGAPPTLDLASSAAASASSAPRDEGPRT